MKSSDVQMKVTKTVGVPDPDAPIIQDLTTKLTNATSLSDLQSLKTEFENTLLSDKTKINDLTSQLNERIKEEQNKGINTNSYSKLSVLDDVYKATENISNTLSNNPENKAHFIGMLSDIIEQEIANAGPLSKSKTIGESIKSMLVAKMRSELTGRAPVIDNSLFVAFMQRKYGLGFNESEKLAEGLTEGFKKCI